MVVYGFVPPCRKVKVCGVQPCVFDKLGCATGEKRLRNTDVDYRSKQNICQDESFVFSILLFCLSSSSVSFLSFFLSFVRM
jgi:hypothetical protein